MNQMFQSQEAIKTFFTGPALLPRLLFVCLFVVLFSFNFTLVSNINLLETNLNRIFKSLYLCNMRILVLSTDITAASWSIPLFYHSLKSWNIFG